MSEAGDTDLRDLVCQILAGKGVLGKIKAEVRANVFHVLNEQKHISCKHPNLEEFSKTKRGEIVLSLVRELLEIFNLKYTVSVFDAEANEGHNYSHHERKLLLQELGLTDTVGNGIKQPVLAQILNNFMWSHENPDSLRLQSHNKEEKSIRNIEKHPEVLQNHACDPTLNPLNTDLEIRSSNASELEDLSKKSYMEEWLENFSAGQTDRNLVPLPITVAQVSEEMVQDFKEAKSKTALVSEVNKNSQAVLVEPSSTTNQCLSSLRNLPPIGQQQTRKNVTEDIMEIVKMGLEKSDHEDDVSNSLSKNELTDDNTSNKIDNSLSYSKSGSEKACDNDVGGAAVMFSDVVLAEDKDDLSNYDDVISDVSDKDNDELSHYSDVISDEKDNLSLHSSLSDKSNNKYSQPSVNNSDALVKVNIESSESIGTVSKNKTCDKDIVSLHSNVKSSESKKSDDCVDKTVSQNSKHIDSENHPQCEIENKENVISPVSVCNQKDISSKTEESDIEEAISFELDISDMSQKDLSTHDTTISNLNEVEVDYMEDL